MALRFVKRGFVPKKSAKRKIVVENYEAIDQFGDLAERKRTAATAARKLGHDMEGWHRRSNDPAGRWNSFCLSCNRAVVVCTEAPDGFADIYGPAFTEDCVVREEEATA